MKPETKVTDDKQFAGGNDTESVKTIFALIVVVALCSSCDHKSESFGSGALPDFTGVHSSPDLIVLSNQVARLRQEILEMKMKEAVEDSAPISPDQKSYSVVRTLQGLLYVSTDHVEPYLDGFRIHLRIGNPNNVTFDGFQLAYTTYTTNFYDLRTGTNAMTVKLTPGRYTPVDFTLAPASMAEVRNCYIRIKLDVIGF